MKQTIILIHGFGVDPTWHWYTWLKLELEKKGYTVKAPAMPNPVTPNVSEWVEMIMEQVEDPEETILCGHSLGALSLLLYLNIYGGRPFRKAIFISTPLGILQDERYELIREFIQAMEGIDWVGIREVLQEAVVIHGEGDLVVPVEHSIELAKQLRVPCRIVPGGHFLQNTFPEVAEIF